MATQRETISTDAGEVDFRGFVDDHRWTTFFVLIEAVLVLTAYLLDTRASFTLEQGGADLTDLTAGLLGGWAVVIALLGAVALIGYLLSSLWFMYARE